MQQDMGRPAGHLDRRLDSAEAASRLVAELVRELRKALDAADATLRLVRTEFRAIKSPPFWQAVNHIQRINLGPESLNNILPDLSASVNKLNRMEG